MAETTQTIVFSGTKEAVESLREVIDAQPGSESQVTPRKNLDGDVAAWIMVANLAVKALPHVLKFLKDYLGIKGRQQVRRLKIGDLEIENPSAEDIERLSERLATR